jgi:hypothetical protein
MDGWMGKVFLKGLTLQECVFWKTQLHGSSCSINESIMDECEFHIRHVPKHLERTTILRFLEVWVVKVHEKFYLTIHHLCRNKKRWIITYGNLFGCCPYASTWFSIFLDIIINHLPSNYLILACWPNKVVLLEINVWVEPPQTISNAGSWVGHLVSK